MGMIVWKILTNRFVLIGIAILGALFYWKTLTTNLETARNEAYQYRQAALAAEQIVASERQSFLKEKKALEELAKKRVIVDKVYVDKIKRVKEIEKIYVGSDCSLSDDAVRVQHEAADAASGLQGGDTK